MQRVPSTLQYKLRHKQEKVYLHNLYSGNVQYNLR